jgi:hypothetical protein
MRQPDGVADFVRSDFGNVYAIGAAIGGPLVLIAVEDQTHVRDFAAGKDREPRHRQRARNIQAVVYGRILQPVDLKDAVIAAAGLAAVLAAREANRAIGQVFPGAEGIG